MASNLKIGQIVADAFGRWVIGQDRDGFWVARQGCSEVLLLDRADFSRFGLEVA